MKVDSLDELKAAFAAWRRKKVHAREPMPEELRSRARRAARKHGEKAVVRVTRVERARLFRSRPGGRKRRNGKTKDKSRSRRGGGSCSCAGAASRGDRGLWRP